jgi:uncharacterized RDD family membrane protein YckC
MQYVSVGRRLVAAVVDSVIVFFGFGFPLAALAGGVSSSPGGVKFNLEGGAALALFGLGFLYYIALEATLGATLGKILVGVRVRSTDGNRIGWTAALVRNAVRIIDVCFGMVGAILIWTSSRRQRLGDRAAGTVVVARA